MVDLSTPCHAARSDIRTGPLAMMVRHRFSSVGERSLPASPSTVGETSQVAAGLRRRNHLHVVLSPRRARSASDFTGGRAGTAQASIAASMSESVIRDLPPHLATGEASGAKLAGQVLSAAHEASWRTPFGSSRGEAQFVPSDLMGRVASVKVSTCSPAASDEWASLYMALCLSIASRA